MPQLNLAAFTNDFLMELEESPDTFPPVQTEAAEPRNEKEVMENESPDTRSLVRIRLPGCFTARRVYGLETRSSTRCE